MSKRQPREIPVTEDMGFVARATPALLNSAGVYAGGAGEPVEMQIDVRPLNKTKDQFPSVLKQSRTKPQFTHVSGTDGGDYVTLPVGHLAAIARKLMFLLDQTDEPFGYELARIAGDADLNPKPLAPLQDNLENLPSIERVSPIV